MTSTPSSRRELLRRALAGTAGIGLAAVPLACDAPSRPRHPAAAASPVALTGGPLTIMIIRHAEKPPDSGKPYGITADGEKDDNALTVQGWTRAGALVELFDPAGGTPVRTGLAKPGLVYAARPKASSQLRPSQTVTPLAARLGLTLVTSHAKGDEKALAAELVGKTGPVLVSWQHESIPAIVAALGTASPTPPASWPDDRFDMVWVFTRNGTGWTFSQVPQLLLADDKADPL